MSKVLEYLLKGIIYLIDINLYIYIYRFKINQIFVYNTLKTIYSSFTNNKLYNYTY